MLFAAGLLALTGASAFVPATRPASFGVQQQRAAAPSMQFGNFFKDDRSDLEVNTGASSAPHLPFAPLTVRVGTSCDSHFCL